MRWTVASSISQLASDLHWKFFCEEDASGGDELRSKRSFLGLCFKEMEPELILLLIVSASSSSYTILPRLISRTALATTRCRLFFGVSCPIPLFPATRYAALISTNLSPLEAFLGGFRTTLRGRQHPYLTYWKKKEHLLDDLVPHEALHSIV